MSDQDLIGYSPDDPVVKAIVRSVRLPVIQMDLKWYTSADIVRVILGFINKRIERDTDALNESRVITDGDKDITHILRGRTSAYVDVKYFIESGLREVAG